MRGRVIVLLAGAAAVAAATVGAWDVLSAPVAARIPTVRVQRGSVQVKVNTTGELRAARATQLIAPPVGGQLQIVRVAQSGDRVHAGDPVVEFDPAEQAFALEQAGFDLDQAAQEIVKADALAAVQDAEDEVAVLHARFEVRRAELAASGNEFLTAVEARKNLMLLDEAQHQLAQLEKDVRSHGETNRAAADVLREKRNKAQLSVQVARRNIDNLIIRAPFDGFVLVRENPGAFGGPIFFGMPIPEFRAGDSAFSGSTIADVVDTSKVEVSAKIAEGDRANVNPGQPSDVIVDATPGTTLHGSVRAVSSVAARQFFGGDVVKQFDVVFDVANMSARIHPGVTAQISISGATLEDALYVPRQAVFESAGRSIVYVRSSAGFDARQVRVKARTDTLAVLENIEPGVEVALVDPRAASASRTKTLAPAAQRAAS